MREIKFRVWTGQKMYYQEETISGSNGFVTYVEIYTGYEELEDTSEYILMQYTGLKDKNGVEIYNGDIIKSTGYFCAVDALDKTNAQYATYLCEWDEIDARYRFKYLDGHNGIATCYIADLKTRCEVIGNIYEQNEFNYD